MSSHYRNPTANTAIGTIDRELRRMQKRADHIHKRYLQGRLSPEELKQARLEFSGIFRPLLQKALRNDPPQESENPHIT